MILEILNLLCHPDASYQVSAQSDLLFGRRNGLKNFKMAAIGHLAYQNSSYSNSESPKHPNASHQVSAQCCLQFKDFKVAAMADVV